MATLYQLSYDGVRLHAGQYRSKFFLKYQPYLHRVLLDFSMSHGSDSNRRPDAYDAPALPTELPWLYIFGFLTKLYLRCACSTSANEYLRKLAYARCECSRRKLCLPTELPWQTRSNKEILFTYWFRVPPGQDFLPWRSALS